MIKIYLQRSLQKRWKKYMLMLLTMILSFTAMTYSAILAYGIYSNGTISSEKDYAELENSSERFFAVLGMNETQYRTLLARPPIDTWYTVYSIAIYRSDTYDNPEYLIGATEEIMPFFGLSAEELPERGDVFLCKNYNYELTYWDHYAYAPLGSYPDFPVLFFDDKQINTLKATRLLDHSRMDLINEEELLELASSKQLPVYYSVFFPSSDESLTAKFYSIDAEPCFHANPASAYAFYNSLNLRGTSAEEISDMFMEDVNEILKLTFLFCLLAGGGAIFMNFRLITRELREDARILLSLGIPEKELFLLGSLPSAVLLLCALPAGILFGSLLMLASRNVFLLRFPDARFYLSAYPVIIILLLGIFLLAGGIFPTMRRISRSLPLELLSNHMQQTEYEMLESKSTARLRRHPYFGFAWMQTIRRKWKLALPLLLNIVNICIIGFLLAAPHYYDLDHEPYMEEDFKIRLVSLKTDQGRMPMLTIDDIAIMEGIKAITPSDDGTYLITCRKGSSETVREALKKLLYQVEIVSDYAAKKAAWMQTSNIYNLLFVISAAVFLLLEILQRFTVTRHHVWARANEYQILERLGATPRGIRSTLCFEMLMQYGIVSVISTAASILIGYFALFRGLGKRFLSIRYDYYSFCYPWLRLVLLLLIELVLVLAAALFANHKYRQETDGKIQARTI